MISNKEKTIEILQNNNIERDDRFCYVEDLLGEKSAEVFNKVYENTEKSVSEMAEWKDREYGDLINRLINKLHTAKFYLVGANGLMSKNEIDECFAKNDCALIRGINRTIRFVNDTISEMKGVE